MTRAEKIGKRIRQWRLFNNVSQEEFAAAIGVSQASVSIWEKGKHKPEPFCINAICNYTGLSADCLLGIGESCDDDNKYKFKRRPGRPKKAHGSVREGTRGDTPADGAIV